MNMMLQPAQAELATVSERIGSATRSRRIMESSISAICAQGVPLQALDRIAEAGGQSVPGGSGDSAFSPIT
jgi:hypothetical protein